MTKNPPVNADLSGLANRTLDYARAHFPVTIAELLAGMIEANATLTGDVIKSALAELAEANTIQVLVKQNKTPEGIDYLNSLIIPVPEVSRSTPTIFLSVSLRGSEDKRNG